jgi:hypothetical protein
MNKGRWKEKLSVSIHLIYQKVWQLLFSLLFYSGNIGVLLEAVTGG